MKNTTRSEMKNLKRGDTFCINGYTHTALTDTCLCEDPDYADEWVVYDEHGEGWFEDDFELDADFMDKASIPVEWIRNYAAENGPEVEEVISYMLDEYANKMATA